MAIKSTPELKSDAAQNFPDNTGADIEPVNNREQAENQADSAVNKITDKLLLNLRDYQTSRSYEVGEGSIFNTGGGDQLYRCIAPTSGTFAPASWASLSTPGSGDNLALGTEQNGLDLVGSDPQVLQLLLASAIQTGSLSSTDWATFNGKQAALGFTPENLTQKGAANGYAPLDSSAKVPTVNLPDALIGAVNYQGTWNASTNFPVISDGAGAQGEYFTVSTAGSQDLGSGTLVFSVGDWVIHNGTIFEKLANGSAGVNSVQGVTGTDINLGTGTAENLMVWDSGNTFKDSGIKSGAGVIGLGGFINLAYLLTLGEANTGITFSDIAKDALNFFLKGDNVFALENEGGQQRINSPYEAVFGTLNGSKYHVFIAPSKAASAQLKLDSTGANFIPSGSVDDGSLWATDTGLFYRHEGSTIDLLLGGGGGGGDVASVFGRVGIVIAEAGDYEASKITNDSSVTGATVKDALDTLLSGGGLVTSVFGRAGNVVATIGDYTSAQVTNASSVPGTNASDADNYLLNNKVAALQEGANITIDNADPLNPIVSASTSSFAGNIIRAYFTADEETLGAGTFYQSLGGNRGVIAEAQEVVVNNDDSKSYFAQDLIGESRPFDIPIPAGEYASNLTVEVSSDQSGIQHRYTVEVYISDATGTVLNNPDVNAPIGDLGVRVLTVLDSGNLVISESQKKNINLTGTLNESFLLLAGQRSVYHVSAEKVGTTGGAVTFTVYYGADNNSYIDVPSVTDTDEIIELSSLSGSILTDSLNTIYNEGRGSKILVVDPSGSDLVGGKGIIYSFLTPSAAVAAAVSGDLIIVNPGTYTDEINLTKDGVNWRFESGAFISNTIQGDIFQAVSNASFKVSGYLDATIKSAQSGDFILETTDGQDVFFEFRKLKNYKDSTIKIGVDPECVDIKGDESIGHGIQTIEIATGINFAKRLIYNVGITRLIDDVDGVAVGAMLGVFNIGQSKHIEITSVIWCDVDGVPNVYDDNGGVGAPYHMEFKDCKFIHNGGDNTNSGAIKYAGTTSRGAVSNHVFSGSNQFSTRDSMTGFCFEYEFVSTSPRFIALGEMISTMGETGSRLLDVVRVGSGANTIDSNFGISFGYEL